MFEGTRHTAAGPLAGVRVIEFAGLGPGPYCGMLLSDLGADVLSIQRPQSVLNPKDVLGRGRRRVELDLKSPQAVDACLMLVERADMLFEGFRPGVMERLGLGPEDAFKRNQRLVYGRITGWGQTGPLSSAAGHDVNYVALSGALGAIGSPDGPHLSLNLIGDMGAGGMQLAFGLLAALICARSTGKGQVVDCAMVEGAASMMSMYYGMAAAGTFDGSSRNNMGNGASHFYNVYKCADGKWISIAAIEPQFYRELLRKTGVEPGFDQWDVSGWPSMRAQFQKLFATRSRNEWQILLEGSDVCFAPVLEMDEAPLHPQNIARRTFVELDGVVQPAVTPRFSETPGDVKPGSHIEQGELDDLWRE